MRLIEGVSKTKSGKVLAFFIPTKEEAGSGARQVHSAWLVDEGETGTISVPPDAPNASQDGWPIGSLMPVAWLGMLEWDESTTEG